MSLSIVVSESKPSFADDHTNDQSISLDAKWLLAIYGVLPLALFLITLDDFVFGRRLLAFLPSSPDDMRAFTVLFRMPHIVSSLLIFCEVEYLRHYKIRLSFGAPLIVMSALTAYFLIGWNSFFLIFSLITAFHVLTQQIGVTRSLVRNVDGWFQGWKWSCLVIGLLVYLVMVNSSARTQAVEFYIRNFLWLVFLPATYCAYRVSLKASSRIAVYYVWSTHALFVTLFTLFQFHYPFFVVFLTQVIHDLTAYGFYMVHNHNRSLAGSGNPISLLRKMTNAPVILLTPLLGIALASPLTQLRITQSWFHMSVVMIMLFHYYTESFSWKRNALHRRYVSLS